MPTTEEMAKRLWEADRLYRVLTIGIPTAYTWENGVSYDEQDKWRYIAEHAIAALTSVER